jgi:hypothetical protein
MPRCTRNLALPKKMAEGKWPIAPVRTVCGVEIKPYIVADGIYPAHPYIVKPWRGAKCRLGKIQNDFNFKQSSTRMPIEHVNGMLKRRFRILMKSMEMWNVTEAVDTAFACVILHNILLSHGLYGADPLVELEEMMEPVAIEDAEDAEMGVNDIKNVLAMYLNGLANPF